MSVLPRWGGRRTGRARRRPRSPGGRRIGTRRRRCSRRGATARDRGRRGDRRTGRCRSGRRVPVAERTRSSVARRRGGEGFRRHLLSVMQQNSPPSRKRFRNGPARPPPTSGRSDLVESTVVLLSLVSIVRARWWLSSHYRRGRSLKLDHCRTARRKTGTGIHPPHTRTETQSILDPTYRVHFPSRLPIDISIR